MNLHEYQGKQLLEKFNVSIQRGFVANNPDEAVECAKKLSNQTGTENSYHPKKNKSKNASNKKYTSWKS